MDRRKGIDNRSDGEGVEGSGGEAGLEEHSGLEDETAAAGGDTAAALQDEQER